MTIKSKKILLTSVFGPFALDDEFGSRKINPMELYHNQVTRFQGVFSLRMFHRSFGLKMLQENIQSPCLLLDYPSKDLFIEQITTQHFDVIGISGIPPNILKVKEMVRLCREHAPHSQVIVGGHVANCPEVDKVVLADHIVKGEGIQWLRNFLGEDPQAPIQHPKLSSAFGLRTLGLQIPEKPGETAAIVIPSVGCPMGCNFCATSAMFGGKGNFQHFYQSGEELFEKMLQVEEALKVNSFFIMDENFLFHRKRALELLELMEQHDKAWSLYVFSSAKILESFGIEKLLRLGISWIWIGLEGAGSPYEKLKGTDTKALIAKMQEHGIKVLGSSIIGFDHHSPSNIEHVIDWSLSYKTDFHQFMLYTPVPGTPLYEQEAKKNNLKMEVSYADTHGQLKFNFHHPLIPENEETTYLERAFLRDFRANGPSLCRIVMTNFKGWMNLKNYSNFRVRRRMKFEAKDLRFIGPAILWVSLKWSHFGNSDEINHCLKGIYKEFGWKTRIVAPILGCFFYIMMLFESRRLKKGWTYEPNTIIEWNEAWKKT